MKKCSTIDFATSISHPTNTERREVEHLEHWCQNFKKSFINSDILFPKSTNPSKMIRSSSQIDIPDASLLTKEISTFKSISRASGDTMLDEEYGDELENAIKRYNAKPIYSLELEQEIKTLINKIQKKCSKIKCKRGKILHKNQELYYNIKSHLSNINNLKLLTLKYSNKLPSIEKAKISPISNRKSEQLLIKEKGMAVAKTTNFFAFEDKQRINIVSTKIVHEHEHLTNCKLELQGCLNDFDKLENALEVEKELLKKANYLLYSYYHDMLHNPEIISKEGASRIFKEIFKIGFQINISMIPQWLDEEAIDFIKQKAKYEITLQELMEDVINVNQNKILKMPLHIDTQKNDTTVMPFIHVLCQTTKRNGFLTSLPTKTTSMLTAEIKFEKVEDKKKKMEFLKDTIKDMINKEAERLISKYDSIDGQQYNPLVTARMILSYLIGEKQAHFIIRKLNKYK